MNDLSETISPKSDQLNADDLITGPKKIRVVGVTVQMGEQPVSIFFEGDNGKPYKPGKSMRRVLCKCWGTNGDAYVGREMVLFCDEQVTWGGKAVGGIRISHLSHITGPIALPLTDKKGSRKLFTVNPLRQSETYAAELKTLTDCTTLNQLKAAFSALSPAAQKALGPDKDRLKLTLT